MNPAGIAAGWATDGGIVRIEVEHADHSSTVTVTGLGQSEANPPTGPVDVLTDLRTARENTTRERRTGTRSAGRRAAGQRAPWRRTTRSGSAPVGRHRRRPSSGGTRDRRRTDRGRLLAICGWATGLGVVALASGARGLALVLSGTAPQWYQPTVAILGLGGIALGGVALYDAARPAVRWTALALANLAVGVSTALTVSL